MADVVVQEVVARPPVLDEPLQVLLATSRNIPWLEEGVVEGTLATRFGATASVLPVGPTEDLLPLMAYVRRARRCHFLVSGDPDRGSP